MTRREPPLCARLPVVGSLPYLFRDKLDFLVQERARCGDIFTVDIGATSVVALCHPRHAQHVLRDHAKNYSKGSPIWESIRGLIGNGLVVSEGDFWLRQRRLIQPQFHKDRLSGMVAAIVDAIDEVLPRWEAPAKTGEPFDAARELTRMVMRIVFVTMFGTHIEPELSDSLAADLGYAFEHMVVGMLFHSLPRFLPVPGRRRFDEVVAKLDRHIYRVIEDQRRRGPGESGSLLGMLIEMVDADTGERMTERQLRDEVMGMFAAGFETTAASLSFTFQLLAHRPDIVRGIRDEARALGGARPSFTDLRKLPLALETMQEALRLYPTAFWLPRTALEDDEIDGYFVPKGTTVGVMSYALHRHPEFFPEPEVFDPSRFSPDNIAARHPLAWVPFGGGQRLCVGKEFALMEGQLILARALSRYDLVAIPGQRARVGIAATLRPKDVWIRLRPARA
jgi:cytochrome P450